MLYARRVALFAGCCLVGQCLSQSAAKKPQLMSLCILQEKMTEGSHESVRVSGVFSEGLDVGVLKDTTCPMETTWVELDLLSTRNKDKPKQILDHSRQALVAVEGEFYGPPMPDPNLPEAIRKAYHPGWGRLAAFKTKLVVHALLDVKPNQKPETRN